MQLAASIIWDARVTGQSIAEDGYNYLKNAILEIAHPHFWDVWRYLSSTSQVIGVMVAIREVATYHKYNTADLDRVLQTCEIHRRELVRTGLLRLENGIPLLSSLSFGAWILRTQTGSGKEIPQPEEWLRQNREIFGLLTRMQIDTIAQLVGRVYEELRGSLIDLGDALVRSRFGV